MQNKLTTSKLLLTLTATMAFAIFAQADGKKSKVDISKLPPASDQQGVTYTGDTKAIFDKSCIKCHGTEKQKGKLRLDSLAGALKGGEEGKIIEPGESAKSTLVHSIARLGDEDFWMPPPDNKAKIPPLTKEQIGLIRAWIDQGAK